MREAWSVALDLIADRHADDPALVLDADLLHDLDTLEAAAAEEMPNTG
jgi:hypothetical protein